ncbi:MAG: DUF1997 domain-containing protein [Chloroherpetonaceae bacterium]|nr:DUF1997 domain-containing protein [Chloroherpetonaceae bacterium]MDW8438793.1 hypothetical protein [Chloroherpetonaceae bacterium]
MRIVGRARGQVVLASDVETVFRYFADHKKILSFNPLCKGVSETEFPNVYRWDFEITDPRSHPIHLIFYVEQSFEPPAQDGAPRKPTDDIITHHDLIRNIYWTEVPIEFEGEPPNDHTFVGLASGQMLIKALARNSTFVDVLMRVTVDFDVPILLRAFPEPVIKTLAEIAMSAGMQNVSNKMLENISKDFEFSVVQTEHSGAAN